MKKIIRKWFWVWDFDNEEKWLNEMSAKGLQLCDVGYCKYTFEDGEPNQYTYRLEMLDYSPASPKGIDYIKFVEDTGAEKIGSMLKWVYFRKKSSDTPFNLFSDISSRVAHLKRILFLIGLFSGINIFNGITQLHFWFLPDSSGTNLFPAILCLTVGLWLGYGFIHIFRKKRKLEKERVLYDS